MAKKIYISVIVGGLVILTIYYFLGGFKDIVVSEKEKIHYRVAGNYFYGKYDDRQVEKYFISAKELISGGKITGELCVIAYKSDTLKEEHISQFIGVAIDDQTPLPEGFEERVFNASAAAIVTLDMHPVAMPNPEKVQSELVEYAKDQGWIEPSYFLEIYKPDNSMIVHALNK